MCEYMGPKPHEWDTVDRKDTKKGYVPGNVQWADTRTQKRPPLGGKKFLWKGKERGLPEICHLEGLSAYVVSICHRVYRHKWNIYRAISTPIKPITRKKLYEVDGIWDTITAHARRYGLSPDTVRKRMANGKTIREALEITGREMLNDMVGGFDPTPAVGDANFTGCDCDVCAYIIPQTPAPTSEEKSVDNINNNEVIK
jgi:hypothetical protein